MIEDSPLIEGDYGEGAYGPTILLRIHTSAGAELLKTLMMRLANSPASTSVSLVDVPGVALDAAVWALNLRVERTVHGKHLWRDSEGGFTWVGTQEDWSTAGQLVEPLVHQRGHQYLTSEIEDDALIEVSRDEHDP